MITVQEEIRPKIEDLESTERDLADLVEKKDKTFPVIKKRVDDVKETDKKKEEQLKGTKERLYDLLDNSEKYHEATREFTDWFDDVSRTPGLVEPIASDVEDIKKQLNEVEVIKCFFTLFISRSGLLLFPHSLV